MNDSAVNPIIKNKNPEKIELYKNEQFVNFNIVGDIGKLFNFSDIYNLVVNYYFIFK